MRAFRCAAVVVIVVSWFASYQGVSGNVFEALAWAVKVGEATTCTMYRLRTAGCYFGVALKSERTGRWCAQDPAGGQGFICNRGRIGPWEKLTVVTTQDCLGKSYCEVFFLSGRTNQYCVHEGEDRFKCEADVSTPTVFRMYFVENGNVVEPTIYLMKNGDGNKICADDAGLRCNRNKVGPWERFKICFKPFWCL